MFKCQKYSVILFALFMLLYGNIMVVWTNPSFNFGRLLALIELKQSNDACEKDLLLVNTCEDGCEGEESNESDSNARTLGLEENLNHLAVSFDPHAIQTILLIKSKAYFHWEYTISKGFNNGILMPPEFV